MKKLQQWLPFLPCNIADRKTIVWTWHFLFRGKRLDGKHGVSCVTEPVPKYTLTCEIMRGRKVEENGFLENHQTFTTLRSTPESYPRGALLVAAAVPPPTPEGGAPVGSRRLHRGRREASVAAAVKMLLLLSSCCSRSCCSCCFRVERRGVGHSSHAAVVREDVFIRLPPGVASRQSCEDKTLLLFVYKWWLWKISWAHWSWAYSRIMPFNWYEKRQRY